MEIFEMKSTLLEMKNILDGINSRLNIEEEKISVFENIVI